MNLSKITTLLSFSFLLLLASNSLFSQTKVKTSIEKETNFEAQEIIDRILKIENYNYVISHKDEKYSCKKYTEEMKFVSKKEFSFEKKRVLSIEKLEKKILFIYTQTKIKKNQKVNTFGHFFNPKSMGLEMGNVVLNEFIYKKRSGTDYLSTIVQNGYLVISINGYTNRKNTVFPKVKLFNNKLEELWSKEIKHSNEKTNTVLRSLIIDKAGEINAVLSYIDEEKKVTTFIEKISSKENNSKKINLSEIQDNIINVTMKLGLNNDLILCGVYSNEFSNVGTYIISINLEKFEKNYHSKIMHSHELLSKGQSKSDKKKFEKIYNKKKGVGKVSLLNLARFKGVDDILLKKDGGYFIINKNTHDYIINNTGEVYWSRNVLVTSISKNGKIEWDQIIAKEQVINTKPVFGLLLRNEVFSDCHYSTSNNSLFCIFNDNSKNFNPNGESKIFDGKMKKSSLFLVQLYPNGKEKKSIITTNKELNGMSIISKGVELKNNKVFYFVSDAKGNKNRKIDKSMTIVF